MIAYSSAEQTDISFFVSRLADFSRCGNLVRGWKKRPGGNHPDGWGIAYRQKDGFRIVRSGKPAGEDPALRELRGTTDLFVGHARYAANTETVNAANAHPFLVQGIALAHNGTFRGRIGEEADGRNVSDTLVFLERLAVLWRDRTLRGLREALSGLLDDPGLVGDYSAANLLIASGEKLFALRRYRKNAGYYTLYLKTAPGLVTAASEPLDETPGWRLMGNGELAELDPTTTRSVFLPGV
jgi:predicted glutamine amidotransferase